MDNTKRFSAPWGGLLKGMSLFCLVLFGSFIIIGFLNPPAKDAALAWYMAMVALPSAFLAGGALFMIRGYTVEAGVLKILRPGWAVRIGLDKLESVEVDPSAMKGSVRTCGNGGLFCFAGWYWNKKLRSYRVFANDPKRAVVLRFADRRLVVSPAEPEKFAETIRNAANI